MMKRNNAFDKTAFTWACAFALTFVFAGCASSGRSASVTIIEPEPDLGPTDEDSGVSADESPEEGDESGEGEGNGTGEETDTDSDGDAVADTSDNCAAASNADQADADGDGFGDECDDDDDGDGTADTNDAFPSDAQETADADADGIGDIADNCASTANADQSDLDTDGSGDECDEDDDGDGTADANDAFPSDSQETADADVDGIGDVADNCAATSNADQADLDADSSGDECDDDDDGDGTADADDAFPRDATEIADTDADGIGDVADNCAATTNADQADLDSDDAGDVCDTDADGDDSVAEDSGGDDCDDADDSIHPGAEEIFNFTDDDCDGTDDAGFGLSGADLYFEGVAANDNLGYDTAAIGDVNGDGYGDFAVSAPYNDEAASGAGKVYIVFGSASWDGEFDADADGYAILGEAANDNAGVSIAQAGDVDGDGYGDILVGATLNDEGGASAGKVYLIYGGAIAAGEGMSLTDADAVFIGENAYDNLGVSVAGVGDVNADGYDDIAMGASGYDNGGDNGAGKAYVFFGGSLGGTYDLATDTADVAFVGENAGDAAGKTVSAAGDADNDLISDILIGAPQNDAGGSNAGKVYLVLGADDLGGTVDLSAADAAFTGENASDLAGSAIAGGADVNGDGFDDILIGAYDNDDAGSGAGKAYVMFGGITPSSADLSAADVAITGEAAGDKMGFALALTGDADGDGDSEILVGAYRNDGVGADSGTAYFFKGSSDLAGVIAATDADAALAGETDGDQAGYAVAADDADDDGIADLLIGANGFDVDAGLNGGKFYFVYVR